MAKRVHRMNDWNSAGGTITSIPQGTVYANNLLVAVDGSIGTGHPPCPIPSIHCHSNWDTAEGRNTVFAHNIPVNCEGDSDTCGHPRINGSPNVFADDTSYGFAIIDST